MKPCPHCDKPMEREPICVGPNATKDISYECVNPDCIFLTDNGEQYFEVETDEDRAYAWADDMEE